MINKEKVLNEMTTNLLIGRTVKISGCVESGEFDLLETIDGIEYTKKITGSGKCTYTSIYDIKIGPSPNGDLLDFSCISEMSVARCSNPDCKSEIEMKHQDDGIFCSRCGNIISEGLSDWVVYKVTATIEKVRLLRV